MGAGLSTCSEEAQKPGHEDVEMSRPSSPVPRGTEQRSAAASTVPTRQLVHLGFGPHVDDLVATAIGGAHRNDPVGPRTGGPAGNARLTAWLGVALLLLFLAEGVTLISMHQLIHVHLLVRGVLVPLTAARTATTGWRMLRYYLGSSDYVAAGPPPLLLRVLGPLVVVTALAVLGTGLALVALGTDASFQPMFGAAGFQVAPLTLHQAAFIAWLAITALHVLARTVPAVKLMAGRLDRGPIPGMVMRAATLLVAAGISVGCGVAVLHYSGSWTHQWAQYGGRDHDKRILQHRQLGG